MRGKIVCNMVEKMLNQSERYAQRRKVGLQRGLERKGDQQREQSVNSEIENIEDIEYRKNCENKKSKNKSINK